MLIWNYKRISSVILSYLSLPQSRRIRNMMNIILYLLLGLSAGVLSGLIGIGGGTIIVPALIYLFGLTQHQAQGTTLALLIPPIGLLAAWTYYKNGYVNLTIAVFICLGFFIGGLVGAKVAVGLSNEILREILWVCDVINSFIHDFWEREQYGITAGF